MRKDHFQDDKQKVLDWGMKYMQGFRRARTREDILPFVQMDDRRFRACASELIHEGQMCSSHKRGYWIVPLQTNDPLEIEAMKECHIERKAKAIDLITDCDKMIKRAEDILYPIRQGQGELYLA
jgi:hypothetical protein